MKIVTFNINSIRARLPNLLDFLKSAAPDAVCLQEIKCEADQFPALEITAAGYHSVLAGQKAYNGVAILTKAPVTDLVTALPNAPDDAARFIAATLADGTRLINVYVPNGNPVASEKFPYKQAWLDALQHHLNPQNALRTPMVLCGDFNIIPEPRDCYDPAAWAGDALFQPAMREWYRAMEHAGFTDAFRALHPNAPRPYTFWDYQGGAWQHDNGIRIDHFLLNAEATDRLQSCTIHRDARAADKASDHVPVEIVLKD